MLIPISEFSGNEPDTDECRTEEIITDLSRCSSNNRRCKYGLPAGTTSTYCLHPEFKRFQIAPPAAGNSNTDNIAGKQRA